MKSKSIFTGQFENKKGKTFIKWTDIKTKVTVTNCWMNFENLIQGQPELTSEANRLLNEHSDEVLRDFADLIEGSVSYLVKLNFDSVFAMFSFDELFPK